MLDNNFAFLQEFENYLEQFRKRKTVQSIEEKAKKHQINYLDLNDML